MDGEMWDRGYIDGAAGHPIVYTDRDYISGYGAGLRTGQDFGEYHYRDYCIPDNQNSRHGNSASST